MTTKTRTQRSARRTTLNPMVALAGMLVLIAAGLVLIYVLRETSQDDDRPVMDFTLPGLSGEVSLADYRGQYVLVNFWASWCPPCIGEMPMLQAYHLAHQDDGFSLLAVNLGEDPATVRRFMESQNFRFPVALDMQGRVSDAFGADSLPTSYLIGPDGKLIKAWRPGAITRAMLERDVTPRLQG